ncbi:MAG: helix-turn-helix domain-containing protein [Pseudomonadota bacterium]
MNAVGDGWSALILRDLLLEGPRRFQDFQESLGSIVPSTLSGRLKRLEADGLIEREIYQDHPVREHYVLTARGKTLGPVLAAMRKWGREHRHG